MKYRVGNSVYADFDRAAGAALMESLESHKAVDITMLTERKVRLHGIQVTAHNIRPAEQCGSASGELRSQEN